MILHTILGLLLLLIPAGALYLTDQKQLRGFALSVGRMIGQLLVLCLMVWVLVHYNRWWLNLLWLVLIAGWSTTAILQRTKLDLHKFMMPVGISVLASVFVVGAYLLFAVLPTERTFAARWFVPVTALLMGHSTTMMIRGMNTYISALKADEQQYEFLRGNGASHLKAVMPFVRRALQAILAPTIANLSTTALFTMPLLLCGILIAGVQPVNAFVVTLMLIVASVTSSVLALIIALWLSDSRLFDKFGKLLTVLALMVLVLSCKGNKGEAVDSQEDATGFYDTRAVARAETSTASPSGTSEAQKAKVVRMYEIPAPLKDRPEQILKRKGYTTSYNSRTKCPNWVAWHLTKSHTYGSNQRELEKFTVDEDAKDGRATDNDYYNSRYDRGHMCPAGDNKWDKEAMEESFLFTNVCPQNHGLNKYEWNDLEILCRDWAREYGAIDIVCGPVFSSGGERYRVGNGSQDTQKTIGRNKVWVPDAFFKVVLCRQGKPKAIGFIYKNLGQKQPMVDAVYTVDEIEAMTGIDFFPALDDQTEDRVEASASLTAW